mgnify:CR=1 FL=1
MKAAAALAGRRLRRSPLVGPRRPGDDNSRIDVPPQERNNTRVNHGRNMHASESFTGNNHQLSPTSNAACRDAPSPAPSPPPGAAANVSLGVAWAHGVRTRVDAACVWLSRCGAGPRTPHKSQLTCTLPIWSFCCVTAAGGRPKPRDSKARPGLLLCAGKCACIHMLCCCCVT